MGIRKQRIFVGDFETTVWEGQTFTEVWASASVELFTDDVNIFHSIGEQLDYFISLKSNVLCYYHNLKFDGMFWMCYLLGELGYTPAYRQIGETDTELEAIPDKEMTSKTFKYTIADTGQWYFLRIKIGKYFIEFRDSFKLLPFSVDQIGKAFETRHRKLSMNYEGFRYAGCPITEEEKRYIANDVLVVKEALETVFSEGHDKMTIGACCLDEYKKLLRNNLALQTKYDRPGNNPFHLFRSIFPDLYEVEIEESVYGSKNADEYIRHAYRGGYCYVVKGKEKKVYKKGVTGDVNSEYPFEMHSMSGSYYPTGYPNFWKGDYIPEDALMGKDRYYYIRIRTRFYLKPGKLPFIQIKDNLLYNKHEMLETSSVYDPKTGKYYKVYRDIHGERKDTRVTLTLSKTDYDMFLNHYDVEDFEILDGCWFYAEIGLFDDYINKYMEKKKNSEGAMRTLAKLFLNNLYGKFAASKDSSFKVAYLKEDGRLGFKPVVSADKTPGYIAIGAAVTSYARRYILTAAQANYHGVDKPGFIYADTDSIHCDLEPEELQGIKVDDKELGCWKLETYWDFGYFTRQKTYIEHVTHENGTPVQELKKPKDPYYNITCATLTPRPKKLFCIGLEGNADPEGLRDSDGNIEREWTEAEREFLFDEKGEPKKYTVEDFRPGLKIPGQLKQKIIPGGVVLYDSDFTMKPGLYGI